MFVIHAYTVLHMIEVKLYVPRSRGESREQLGDDRLLAGVAEPHRPGPAGAQIADMVRACFQQMENKGEGVVEVLDL